MKKTLFAACALRVTLDGDMVRLMPAGRFDAPRGAMAGAGPWYLSEERARKIITLAAMRTTDICIDWEHQTLLSEQNGKPAPASGWVDPRTIEWRADGLYGRVDWKEKARQAIDADEYRYLSPVFPYNENGEPLDIFHIALTNTPAIDTAVPALAAARMASTPSIEPEEDSMDKEKLLKALALEDSATDEQIAAALAALNKSAEDVAALRQALDVKDGEKIADRIAALKASAQPNMSQYVPLAVFEETKQQLAALSSNGEMTELKQLITDGLTDGRIPGKATADWLKGKGLAACKNYLQDAPPVAALKGITQTGGKQPEADKQPNELSKDELAVCKSMGLSPEAFRAANPVQTQ